MLGCLMCGSFTQERFLDWRLRSGVSPDHSHGPSLQSLVVSRKGRKGRTWQAIDRIGETREVEEEIGEGSWGQREKAPAASLGQSIKGQQG